MVASNNTQSHVAVSQAAALVEERKVAAVLGLSLPANQTYKEYIDKVADRLTAREVLELDEGFQQAENNDAKGQGKEAIAKNHTCLRFIEVCQKKNRKAYKAQKARGAEMSSSSMAVANARRQFASALIAQLVADARAQSWL